MVHHAGRLFACALALCLLAAPCEAEKYERVEVLFDMAENQSGAAVTRQQVAQVLSSIEQRPPPEHPPEQLWPGCRYVDPTLIPEFTGVTEYNHIDLQIDSLGVAVLRLPQTSKYPSICITSSGGDTYTFPVT